MKTAYAILAVAIAVSLSGCVMPGKPKVSTPPPPQPAPVAAAPAPTPPSQPLSMPQTEVKLAPDQPIDPDALTKEATAASPQEAPPPTRPTRPRVRSAPPVATEPPAAPVTPPAATPLETERGTVREVLPEAERNRLQNSAQSHRREVTGWLNGSKGRRIDPNNPTVVRIRSLLAASLEAEGKGDMREASDLADRAVTFLRELQSGR